ncbi:hypothetical protein Tco_0201584 [Tanacetum coccineum]
MSSSWSNSCQTEIKAVIVEKLLVVFGDFGMALFVDVGDFGIGVYCWYDDEEIVFCDDGVDGFEAFSCWYDELGLRSHSYFISYMKRGYQLHLDEEPLRETLKEQAMDAKAREEKIRQKQADDDEFFFTFGRVRIDLVYESSD